MDAKEALEKVKDYVSELQMEAPGYDDSRVYLERVEMYVENMLKEYD